MSDETFIKELAGRPIEFRYAKPGQLLILKRMTERVQSQLTNSADGADRGALFSGIIQRSLDVVESLVVNPPDAAFLEEQMLMGHLDHETLMQVLWGPDDKPKKAAKTVKTTPKAAPKKATTTVASRGRTKR